jgi:hypothetical protein
MAIGKGFQGICGHKKAATWGTAIVVGAANGIQVLSLDTPGNQTWGPNAAINGTIQSDPSIPGNKVANVTLRTHLYYEGVHPFIAHVMGTAGVPATVDTSGKAHVFKVLNDTVGIFETLAYEIVKDTTVVELPGVKWHTFTISGSSGQACTFEAQGIADDYLYGTSATNTTVTIDSVTVPTNKEIAHFKHSTVLMNAQSGADFAAPVGTAASTDDMDVSGWSFTVRRPLEAVFSTLRAGLTSEPRPTADMFEVSGSLDFASLDSARNALAVTGQLAGTAMKLKITLTGATLAGAAASKFAFTFWFPYVELGEGKPAMSDAGTLKWSIPFVSKKVAAIPTGFTATYTDAITIDNVNKDAANPLA